MKTDNTRKCYFSSKMLCIVINSYSCFDSDGDKPGSFLVEDISFLDT